jgi:ketosteroid isomerase-like protein
MKKMLLVITFLVAAAIPTFAQTAVKTPDQSNGVEQTVLKLTQGWLAAEERHDRAALDGIIADDFLGTGPGGNAVSKGDIIPRDGTRAGGLSVSGQDIRVRVFGNAAVVIGRGVAKTQEKGELRFTVVFVKREDRWQMVAGHLSRVPQQ